MLGSYYKICSFSNCFSFFFFFNNDNHTFKTVNIKYVYKIICDTGQQPIVVYPMIMESEILRYLMGDEGFCTEIEINLGDTAGKYCIYFSEIFLPSTLEHNVRAVLNALTSHKEYHSTSNHLVINFNFESIFTNILEALYIKLVLFFYYFKF